MGTLRRLLHGSSPRGRQHDDVALVPDGAGARARGVAAAEEDVGAGRPDNRRPGVLGDHEPAERTRRLVRPRQFGLDPERQAVGPNRPVDRDRTQRGERNASAGDRTERRVEIVDEPEEHERAIAPHQRQSSLARRARSHAFRLASDIALSAISPVSIRIRPIDV